MSRLRRPLLVGALTAAAVLVLQVGPGRVFDGLLQGLGQTMAFFYDVIPSYGVAIILLTAAVRLVMLPLTIQQTRSMQAMQKLQPEMKRIQAKHKGDRQKLNEEVMKLYQEHRVNPLGGCLPLVLQLPVFIALYRVFSGCGKMLKDACDPAYIGVLYLPVASALRQDIVAGHAAFLGMNLGLAPSQVTSQEGILASLPYYLLIVLMAATTWYQQKQVASMQTGQAAAQMQLMGKIMPVMLAFFSWNFPAGVSLYWVASNVWTIGQQYLLLGRRQVPGGGPAAAAPDGSAMKTRPGPSRPEPKPAKPSPKPAGQAKGGPAGNSQRRDHRKGGKAVEKGASGKGKSSNGRKKRGR